MQTENSANQMLTKERQLELWMIQLKNIESEGMM